MNIPEIIELTAAEAILRLETGAHREAALGYRNPTADQILIELLSQGRAKAGLRADGTLVFTAEDGEL